MTDRDTIISAVGTAALVAAMVAGIASQVKAQARHDHDQRWIKQTIREEDRRELEKHYGEPVELVRRPRRTHSHSHYDPRDWRHERQRRHDHDRPEYAGTRVYGVVMRREGFSERDATAHVQCYPPVQGISNERSSQSEAWEDAVRDWANKVRWTYGEKFIDPRNANPMQRQCNISTVSESVVGKLTSDARAAAGGEAYGSRWRCVARGGPCQAAIEPAPELKGELKQ